MGATTSTTAGTINFSFPLKLEMDESLSRARFLKSHRCHDETGYFVVKTYVKPPGFTATKDYKRELEGLKRNLTPHLAPYQYIVENEKTIQGVRQYFHSSLSSRLSTLPFMTKIEKKWITYQLLVYLEKAEKWGLFHGDLKCENVMLTSWNWIFVTDHAFSYKPLYLPNQNYGGFSYFFDTSNRTCYMAPERFGGSEPVAGSEEDVETKLINAKTKMDVFSMGCVIAELWLEQDRRLFEYGSMLRYKEGSDEPLNILSNIQDPNIRQLVQDMVHRDPELRHSASAYLRQWTGTLFPYYFETLHDALSKILTTHPNERVRRIDASLEDLHRLFTERSYPASAIQLLQSSLPTMATATSAPFVDAPSPFSTVPFSKPHIPSKTDVPGIKNALKPLITEDARLEISVQFPSLAFENVDSLLDAIFKQGFLENEKIESFILTCKTADALLPIGKLLESIAKQDSLFELPKAKETFSSGSAGSRSAPVFQADKLGKGEMRFVDGQGGLMSATLASEALLRQLLAGQDCDSKLREIDVNHFTSDEIRNLLQAHPIEITGQPTESTLLAHAQSETHCRKLLEECFSQLDQITSREAAFPDQAPSLDASQSSSESSQSNLSSHPSINAERKEVEQKMMVAFEMLSTLYRERGEFRHSLAFQQAFLGRAKHWKDAVSLMRGFQQYGLTCHSMGAFDEAIASYKQSLVFANQIRSKRALLDLYRLLSEAYADKSVLQTATYYHKLYDDLHLELKGALDSEGKIGIQNRSNSSIPRGTISVTPHKLLFTPTKNHASSMSGTSRYGTLTGSPLVGNLQNQTPKKPTESSFAAAITSQQTTPSVRSDLTSGASDFLPVDEPDTLGYVIILDILCAMLPYLTDTSLKLTCLDCFVKISKYADDEIRLQRLIPCLVSYLDSTRDPSALVRAQTIKTLAHVITLINEFPIDDAHIFQDYLIPVLKFVLKDERESIVHQAFAEALPKLARSARLCLNHSQLHRHHHLATATSTSVPATTALNASGVVSGDASSGPASAPNGKDGKKDSVYENDLRELRQVFHEILTEWLENAPVIVKRTVLEDVGTLAEFFGPEGTNNHLLQLIFSWLNFSEWELKCAVFDNIVGVSQVAGPDAIESYIESYLPIHDESEFVIDSAVNCLASLTEAGIFSPHRLREYTIQVAPLLLHPNAWIRFATVNFMGKISGRLTPVEVQCFIIPHLRRFLTHDITQLTQVALLHAMHAPVSRSAYEKAMAGLNLNPSTQFSTPTQNSASTGVLSAVLASPEPSNRATKTLSESSAARRFNMLAHDAIASDFVVVEASGSSSNLTPSKSAQTSESPTLPSSQTTPSATTVTTNLGASKAAASLDLTFSLGLAELDLEPQDEEKLFWMKEYVKEARRMRVDYKRGNLTTDSWAAEYTRLSREKTVHEVSQFMGPMQTPTSAVMPSLDRAGPEEPTELWKAMFGSSGASEQGMVGSKSAASLSGSGHSGSAMSDEPRVKVVDSASSAHGSSQLGASGGSHQRGVSVSQMSGAESGAPGSINVPSSASAGPASPAPASAGYVATREPGALNLGTIRVSKSAAVSTSSATSNWCPQGILVATLSEHEEAVTQLQVTRDGAFFASGSHDGKVKIWDSQQFEHNGPLRSACTYAGLGSAITAISICQDSHSVAAASIQGAIHVFRIDAGSSGHVPGGNSASGSMVYGSAGASSSSVAAPNSVGQGQGSQGAVGGSSKDSRGMSAHVVRRLDQNDGVILKLEHFDKGTDSTIVFATDRGDIRAWDLRTQKEPWAIANSPHLGLITSLMVDPQRNWLAVGTDAGNFTCWDIRFRVPLLHWALPSIDGMSGIHALAADPTQSACFWASFGPGLVGHWNLESGQCRKLLRVAPREPILSSQKTPPLDWDSLLVPSDVSASGDDFRIADLQKPLTESARSLEAHLNTIRAINIAPGGNFALTGGADRKLRFWNFDAPQKSCIISGKDPREDISYNTWETSGKHISGLEEVRSPTRDGPLVAPTQPLPSTGHCDTILDVKVLELHSKKVMAISASRDGVIKVWK
jgi:WD40 repeat protein/serine/threonine protein kinase